jgi:hypothetical protein
MWMLTIVVAQYFMFVRALRVHFGNFTLKSFLLSFGKQQIKKLKKKKEKAKHLDF